MMSVDLVLSVFAQCLKVDTACLKVGLACLLKKYENPTTVNHQHEPPRNQCMNIIVCVSYTVYMYVSIYILCIYNILCIVYYI